VDQASDSNDNKEGYDDDDEPTGSRVGLTLLRELHRCKNLLRRQSTIRIRGGSESQSDDGDDDNDEEEECCADGDDGNNNSNECGPPVATAIIVVRYFEERLLGVTCGRLRSVYERTARLALHRHLNGRDVPFVERYTFSGADDDEGDDDNNWKKNLYGLGAGDTELILNVVPLDDKEMNDAEGKQTASQLKSSIIVKNLLSELQFEGMVGSKNELLPRLQNLQADLPIIENNNSNSNQQSPKDGIILPLYRYPGNYSGTEWPTHPWSPTSLSIKRSVEQALQPLYIQHMNHCVANLYRDGSDRIDHHSDKDLDLNREGVIVSVSLGCARVMEVRDRNFPHDFARVELPPNSMFVLGPYTNARFTHAVLPRKCSDDIQKKRVSFGKKGGEKEEEGGREPSDDLTRCSIEGGGRISLTFRDVRTFLDVKTQRLFGQGVSSSSVMTHNIDVNDNGIITEESLAKAVHYIRDQDKNDRGSAMVIAMGIGATAGYVSSKSSDGSNNAGFGEVGETAKSTDVMALLRSISTMVISASASYWYLQRARSRMRQQRDEKEARVFFSKKSASGNKY